MRMFMVLLLVADSSSPRVDRENTGTSSNGGGGVGWKACDILMHWHSNGMMREILFIF